MKMRSIVQISVLFAVVAVVMARADSSATKEQLLNQFLALPSSEKVTTSTVDNISNYLIEKDFRFSVADKPKLEKDLRNAISVDRVRDEQKRLFDQNFTEEELDYLVKLRTSPLGRKMDVVMPKINEQIVEFTRSAAKAKFESVTHLNYIEPTPPGTPPRGVRTWTDAGWYTRLIWRLFPSTTACPPAGVFH